MPQYTCQVLCDYIPRKNYPLLQAREVLHRLAKEGVEDRLKEAERPVGRDSTKPAASPES